LSNHRLPKTIELNALLVSSKKLEDSEGKDVWIVATHSDIEINHRIYTSFAMRNGTRSFTKPYKKPVLLSHDDYRDAIGRVLEAYYFYREDWAAAEKLMGASVEFPENATGAVVLKAVIRDAEAIKKIEDERYFSVSIGFTTEIARCSICDKNWAEGPCKHVPGRKYGDEKCVLVLEHMDFREISFVNEPADKYASVVIAEEEQFIYNADKETGDTPVAQEEIVDEKTNLEENDMDDKKLQDLESKVEKLEKIAKTEILNSMFDKLNAFGIEKKADEYDAMDIDTLSAFRNMVNEIIDAAKAKMEASVDVEVFNAKDVNEESKETPTNSVEINKTQPTQDLSDVNMVAEITENDIAKDKAVEVKEEEAKEPEGKEPEVDAEKVEDNADDAKPENAESVPAVTVTDSTDKKKRIDVESKNAVISTDADKNRVTERPLEHAKKLLGIK
jgi:hypothetical protein